MGVLERFERRLGGMVEGAFARVFGGVVQPVEVAAGLQKEAADKKAIVGPGRVLVPNDYVVELGPGDFERLGEYDAALRRELAAMVTEHGAEQGWSFVGAVRVRFELVEDIATGVFRVRSAVLADSHSSPSSPRVPRDQRPGGRPRLVLVPPGRPTPAAGQEEGEQVLPLDQDVTTIGRGAEATVRLHDSGVSRRHAEVRLVPGGAEVLDLDSTNGTTLNGRRVSRAPLRDGDEISVGATTLVFRVDH